MGLTKPQVVFVRSSSVYSEPRLHKSAKALVKNRWKVRVLAWDKGHVTGIKKVELIDGYEVLRIRIKAPFGMITVLPYMCVWNLCQLFFHILSSAKVIHACDLDTMIPALIAKMLKKKKVVYDIYDFYADKLSLEYPTYLRRFTAAMERFLMRFADLVIIADDSRREQIKGAKVKKFLVIYNSPMEIVPKSRKSLKRSKGKFRIFYAGKLTFGKGIELVANAIRSIEDVELLIAGFEGMHTEKILDLVFSSPNCQYIGGLSYDKVLEFTTSSNMLFALYDPSIPNNKYASPNKLFEAMACSKPIIVTSGTSMAVIVERYRCGLAIPYGDINRLKDVILFLKDNPKVVDTLGENGYVAYQSVYAWEKMGKKLLREYKQLIY